MNAVNKRVFSNKKTEKCIDDEDLKTDSEFAQRIRCSVCTKLQT